MLTAKQFEVIVLKDICNTGNVTPTTAVAMITTMKELEKKALEINCGGKYESYKTV